MKNYLIIGASSGIGKALAQQLADQGYNVYGTFNENSTDISGVSFHRLNVEDDEIDLGFLPDELDGLAYCPGTINLKPFHRIKPDTFRSDYELQVIGAIKVIQSALPRLKKRDVSSIVMFSTIAVQIGFPFHSLVASSKGALEGLTKSLAAEYAPRIRVNCIAPSLTHTPLAARLLSSEEKAEAQASRHPLKKIGSSDDIAAMARFLLTDQSSWISGQVMHVDGGLSTLKV